MTLRRYDVVLAFADSYSGTCGPSSSGDRVFDIYLGDDLLHDDFNACRNAVPAGATSAPAWLRVKSVSPNAVRSAASDRPTHPLLLAPVALPCTARAQALTHHGLSAQAGAIVFKFGKVVENPALSGVMLYQSPAGASPCPKQSPPPPPPPSSPPPPPAPPAGKAGAFFRFDCKPLLYAPVDPIKGNGVGAFKHTHVVFGSDAMAPRMGEGLVTGMLDQTTCTTCQIDADRSLYWFPALMARNRASGKLTQCRSGAMHVYYFARGKLSRGQTRVRAFPKGLRMMAGQPSNTEVNARTQQSKLSFRHIDNKGCDRASDGFPSSTDCGIWQPRIHFPNCWDGERLVSDDFSHVVYRQSDDTCPESHPILIVRLSSSVHSSAQSHALAAAR